MSINPQAALDALQQAILPPVSPELRPQALPSSATRPSHQNPQLTPEQSRSLLDTLARQGVPHDRLAAAAAADGHTWAPPVPSDPAERVHQAWFPPAPTDGKYGISYYGRGGAETPVAELAAFNTAASDFVGRLGMDASMGSHIIETLIDDGRGTWNMRAPELEAWQAKEHALLVKVAKSEEVANQWEKTARAMINLTSGEFSKIAAATPHSAKFTHAMVLHSWRRP